MIGVAVWLRTKNRSFGIVYDSPAAASQRISALVPNAVNHSGGSGLRIGAAARAQAGTSKRPRPASTGRPAAPSCNNRRRVSSSLMPAPYYTKLIGITKFDTLRRCDGGLLVRAGGQPAAPRCR